MNELKEVSFFIPIGVLLILINTLLLQFIPGQAASTEKTRETFEQSTKSPSIKESAQNTQTGKILSLRK